MERYAGRVAVVTGASSGIGAAVARELVQAGIQVVGIARRIKRVQDLAEELRSCKDCQGKLHPLQVDVSRPEDLEEAFRWVDSKLGGISILVNNAAVMSVDGVSVLDTATIISVLDTNVVAVALASREAIRSMKRHKIVDGYIVNLNSICGHVVPDIPGLDLGLYSSSKYAVTALCKALRFEVRQLEGFKIRVTSISPGTVATDMIPAEYQKIPDSVLKTRDVVRAICFALAGPPEVCITELSLHATSEVI